jgi:hypothetical protein
MRQEQGGVSRVKRTTWTTWLGTYTDRRGKRHRIPHVLRTNDTDGTTLRGWIVVMLAILLLITIELVEEFVF